jgi:hypothetical protein
MFDESQHRPVTSRGETIKVLMPVTVICSNPEGATQTTFPKRKAALTRNRTVSPTEQTIDFLDCVDISNESGDQNGGA